MSQPGVGDLRIGERQDRQFGHPAQVCQARVRDSRAVEVQCSDVSESAQVSEPEVTDRGRLDVESLELGHAPQMAEPAIADGGAAQRKLTELGQPLDVCQSIISRPRHPPALSSLDFHPWHAFLKVAHFLVEKAAAGDIQLAEPGEAL
jgi:hypothetical protein